MKHLARLLADARFRRKQGTFVIEGMREIERALHSGFQVTELYHSESLQATQNAKSLQNAFEIHEIFALSAALFAKLTVRDAQDGVLAIAVQKSIAFDQLTLGKNPIFLVAEAIEKPGNLGAILRSADATGIDAVIVCNPLADVFNPHVIRSSLGCVFSLPIVVTSSEMAIHWLSLRGISIYTAALVAGAVNYTQCDYTRPCALVVGTEASGLSQAWLSAAENAIIIPMLGIADSLNVSVSAAVLLFEAIRQRQT